MQVQVSHLLRSRLAMADNVVPAPNGKEGKSYSAYVRVNLFHATQDQRWRTKSIKTGTGVDVMWNERFEWECDQDDLAFLRWAIISATKS